jgi:PrtD family type I secretion system ABC transporter
MSALRVFLREHGRGHIVALLIFSVISNLLILGPSFHMLQMYDRVLSSGSVSTLLYVTLITLFCLVIYGVSETVRSRIANRLAAKYAVAVSRKMFARFALMPNASGSAGKYLRDYSTARSFLSSKVFVHLFDLPFVPLFVLLLYFVHPTIGLLTAAALLLMVGIGYLNYSMTEVSRKESSAADGDAMGFAQVALGNGREVRSLGMLPALISRWGSKTATSLVSSEQANTTSNNFYSIGRVLRQAIQVIIMAWGTWLVLNKDMSGGMIFLASMISGKALGPFEQAIGGWENISKSLAALASMEELVGPDKTLKPRPSLPEPTGNLRAEGLFLTSDGTQQAPKIINGVSVQLVPGKILAIAGAAGSGKSTLLALLAGAVQPTQGVLALDNAAQELWPVEQWGRAIGYLADQANMFPGTVAENIARYRATDDLEPVYAAARKAGIHDQILKFPMGYQTPLVGSFFTASAGQRQAIGLARAFYGNPKVLILDNPTAFLDQAAEDALIQTLIQERAQGKAIVVATRRKSILTIADGAMLMRNGRGEFLDLGTPQAAAAQPAPQVAQQAIHQATPMQDMIDVLPLPTGHSNTLIVQ